MEYAGLVYSKLRSLPLPSSSLAAARFGDRASVDISPALPSTTRTRILSCLLYLLPVTLNDQYLDYATPWPISSSMHHLDLHGFDVSGGDHNRRDYSHAALALLAQLSRTCPPPALTTLEGLEGRLDVSDLALLVLCPKRQPTNEVPWKGLA